MTTATQGVNVAITGANKGIGLELCRQLLAASASDNPSSLPFPKVGTLFALCRKVSEELTQLASENDDKVVIVEGLDLLKKGAFDGGQAVTTALKTNTDTPVPIHVLIHNAGAYGPPENFGSIQEFYHSQSLTNVTPEHMMYAFQLNTMAPLFLTKALQPNLKAAAQDETNDNVVVKVIIVTSLMGSVSDNQMGGVYAYRSSKSAVNMVGKSLSCDLPKWLGKAQNEDNKTSVVPASNVAVGLVHPGAVATDFVPPSATGGKPTSYQKPVDKSVRGVWEAILVSTTPEATGKFWHGNYGDGVKECEW